MTSTVDLTLGREQVADVVEALRHRATGIRSGCDSYNVPELVARADLLDGLADAIDHKAAGQLALDAVELLANPAEHECDCMCQACTDQWRPEDAAPALLEAERHMAERAAAAADPRGERDR